MAHTWLQVTVLILTVIATNNTYAAEISFPDHVTIDMEGDNAMFQCSLTLTSGEAGNSHGILWIKNDTIVIATSDSISDASGKYALDGFSTAMNTALSQTLKVTNTDISDLGTYQCIFILNTQRTNVKASARLYIRNFVPPPTCPNPTQTIVMPNDQVTLRCTADPGDPAIQMMWSPANSGGVSLASSTQQFNNHLSLEYILSVPNNVQGVISYNCHTFMQGSGVTKSCTTSLLVLTAQVKLLISQSPEMVMAGQDVNFICFVSDGHTPASIAWSFPNSGTIVHSTAGSTLSIFNVQSSYDGLIVTCTVNTTDGQQESETAVLNVIATTATATTLTQHTTTLTQHTTTTTTTTMVPTQTYTMTPTALWITLSTDRQQTLLSDGTSRSHDITRNQSVSPLNEKGDESPLSTMLIIIIAVCGSIFLVFVTCIIVICCFLKPQAPKSAHDINFHMEYYKNVNVEDELKDNMAVTEMEIDNSARNDFSEPTYINYDLESEEKVNEIYYYKDDGWKPPAISNQTTTL
ncbi:uncharacterized protein LOC117102765 [Anneissia japonica]|uniref:uncharacterized protein LOC117102765 n=1 Tax=Anneissia japonica TaxID=1529436 RepID=UPI0014255D2E|nr:uncharacterized protein LOC117102765 [Anneissia japonica]